MTSFQLQNSRLDINLERDYISTLPTEVKEAILIKIPIKEAVRTSLLSTKWKYAWISIPSLVFMEDCKTSKLIRQVDMALLMHHGPILQFKLSCKQACNGAMGRWMFILSRNGIKDLYVTIDSAEKCLVPSNFFLCVALEHVLLSNSTIYVPQVFQGFKFLRTLKLLEFNITGLTLSKLISYCPLLVTLLLSGFIEEGYLMIHAPNLTWLRISGQFGDLCLEAPKLLFAAIFSNNSDPIPDHGSNILGVLGSLFAIEELRISCNVIMFPVGRPIPEDLPVFFYHLKVLCIDLYSLEKDEAAVAFCLFRRAPNLKVLTLRLFENDDPSPNHHTLWDVNEIESNLFQCLEIVKITYFEGPESILDVAEFVLSTAPMLEKLTIATRYADNLADGMSFLKKLLSFPRVSKMAQVVFV